MSRILIAFGLSLALLAVACGSGSDSRPPQPGDGDADADADADSDADSDGDADGDAFCVDDDGDGYGVGFRGGCLGEDCDDNDAEAWEVADCATCPAGAVRRDCPCFGTEAPVECHSDELYEDEHGRFRCLTGEMFCVEVDDPPDTYAWGPCHLEDGSVQ
jgi:hypothetical protein